MTRFLAMLSLIAMKAACVYSYITYGLGIDPRSWIAIGLSVAGLAALSVMADAVRGKK